MGGAPSRTPSPRRSPRSRVVAHPERRGPCTPCRASLAARPRSAIARHGRASPHNAGRETARAGQLSRVSLLPHRSEKRRGEVGVMAYHRFRPSVVQCPNLPAAIMVSAVHRADYPPTRAFYRLQQPSHVYAPIGGEGDGQPTTPCVGAIVARPSLSTEATNPAAKVPFASAVGAWLPHPW